MPAYYKGKAYGVPNICSGETPPLDIPENATWEWRAPDSLTPFCSDCRSGGYLSKYALSKFGAGWFAFLTTGSKPAYDDSFWGTFNSDPDLIVNGVKFNVSSGFISSDYTVKLFVDESEVSITSKYSGDLFTATISPTRFRSIMIQPIWSVRTFYLSCLETS